MSIISNRVKGWVHLEFFQGAIVAVILFLLSLLVHSLIRGNEFSLHKYAIYGVLIVVTSIVCALYRMNGKYSISFDRHLARAVSAAFGQTAAVAFVLFLYFTITRDQSISRFFLFTYLPALFFTLIFTRKILDKYLRPLMFGNAQNCDVLLFGDPAKQSIVTAWLQASAQIGLRGVGWVVDHMSLSRSRSMLPGDLPVLGTVDEIERILGNSHAKALLVADLIGSKADIPKLKKQCEDHGVRLILNIDFGQLAHASSFSCYQDELVSLLTLRNEPLESPLNRVLKRAVDCIIAMPIVLIVLPPLALAVRLMQLWQSRGPLIFKQERVGLKGRPFAIYKFRTMHLHHEKESKQAVMGDSRIYPLGRWLRRTSLDEFPQFINVLRGDMSIVGPRPHIRVHDDHFATLAASYKTRFYIKPGITGLAQVRGFRGAINEDDDVTKRTSSDLFYVENWSLNMDLLIILRTALQFLGRQRGAV